MKELAKFFREYHKYLGVVLAIPIILVGLTAILIAHERLLGTKDKPVAADWLPGYSIALEPQELKCSLVTGGKQYVGTKMGLYLLEQGKTIAVKQFEGIEIRSLVETQKGILVGGKKGTWLFNGNSWQQVYKGDVHNLSVAANGQVTMVAEVKNKEGHERQLFLSQDAGLSWNTDKNVVASIASLPPVKQEVTISKLVLDIHTGKAIFGKNLEWIWIDAIGFIILFLTVTGIYLWVFPYWFRRNKESAKAKAKPSVAKVAPVLAKKEVLATVEKLKA
jgi:hypothetical protein